jgi:hypothetical protein
MLGAFSSVVLLWILYGFSIGSLPIIVTNIATLALAAALVGMKMKFGLRGLGAVEVQAKLSSEKILFHFRLNLSLNLPSPGASSPSPQPDRHPF